MQKTQKDFLNDTPTQDHEVIPYKTKLASKFILKLKKTPSLQNRIRFLNGIPTPDHEVILLRFEVYIKIKKDPRFAKPQKNSL